MMKLPQKLNRSNYILCLFGFVFGIGIITAVFLPFLAHVLSENLFIIFICIIMSFKFLVLDTARLRSIGWSPWLVILMVISFINGILQILLLVMPPDSQSFKLK
jgi:hypothetical protein